MHGHPPDIPVVQYYTLNGVNFTYTWRAGSTSIDYLARKHGAQHLDHVPETCTLFLKHPIERFRSSQLILPERVTKTPEGNFIERPPMDEYLQLFLDNDPVAISPHNMSQLAQHESVKYLQLYRLEGSTHLAGVELPWLNRTTEEKASVEDHPRYQELLDYYAEDLKAWESATPLTDLTSSSAKAES